MGLIQTLSRLCSLRWLAVRTMPQHLIGCRKRRKLKALIPRVVVFVNDPSSVERRIDFAVFFIVLWSYGRKICLNMCHGNSENSYFWFMKILRQQKNRNFSILNSSAPSQNNKTSRTSCRCLFENILTCTPTEITFEISFNLSRS